MQAQQETDHPSFLYSTLLCSTLRPTSTRLFGYSGLPLHYTILDSTLFDQKMTQPNAPQTSMCCRRSRRTIAMASALCVGTALMADSAQAFAPNQWATSRLRQVSSFAASPSSNHINAQRLLDAPKSSPTRLAAENDDDSVSSNGQKFDLDTALFCAGLAFDAYSEPPSNSSRWEKGSKGMDVAFLSTAYTRNLYKGLVEVTPLKCTGLPDEDDLKESVMTGGGVDAYLLVAAVEGQWKEDVDLLEMQYHEGVLDLSGATHVSRSRTAWANVNENKSKAAKKKEGKALPYHIKKGWGRDAAAVWADEDPVYLYLQDPSQARLVFTIMDEDVVGGGSAVGSTHTKLTDLIPLARMSQQDLTERIKRDVMQRIQSGDLKPEDVDQEVARMIKEQTQAWEGELKLSSKPRIKDKNGQVMAAAAAGAMLAGPAGAAVGAIAGSFYEGQIKGRIDVRLRYLPIPQTNIERSRYEVLGGLPGVNWGDLYQKYLSQRTGLDDVEDIHIAGNDLEHCFFINHDVTGGCCAVYRSLQKKLIVVSFRGTCTPIDLVTDASIIQDPWVEGEDEKEPETAKVHAGFRKSMNSISRRLKELLLATVEPGETLADYDMLVTGHSLGGALATLFVADVGEFGLDAGRALPQTEKSDAWWKAIQSTFMGSQDLIASGTQQPPRPKSLKLYNFGSPRVGNRAFTSRFDSLLENGKVDEAYRIVNDQDIVARMPRTMYTLSVDYDHCGSTVLVVEPTQEDADPTIWVEGESDGDDCSVRDYSKRTSSPVAEGTLLGDIVAATQDTMNKSPEQDEKDQQLLGNLGKLANRVGDRLKTVSASDITSIVGIDRTFTDRELQIVNSLLQGKGLAHHMEDKYYAAMGRAGGFVALVDEEIVPVQSDTVKLLATAEEAQQEDQIV